MNLPVKITLLSSGIFLLAAMLAGIVKWRRMLASENHAAPAYIDIAHRAALLYSFAALVMAKLLEFSPYSTNVQLIIAAVPLFYFAVTIARYLQLGFGAREETQFSERNFVTTWGMYLLILGEIGGVAAIVWSFVETQFLAR
jgi:hypothetical protein